MTTIAPSTRYFNSGARSENFRFTSTNIKSKNELIGLIDAVTEQFLFVPGASQETPDFAIRASRGGGQI